VVHQRWGCGPVCTAGRPDRRSFRGGCPRCSASASSPSSSGRACGASAGSKWRLDRSPARLLLDRMIRTTSTCPARAAQTN